MASKSKATRGTGKRSKRLSSNKSSKQSRKAPRRAKVTSVNGAAAFFAAQTRASKILASNEAREYRKALSSWWNGEHSAALDVASGALARSPEHPLRLALYRLWIEILASAGERMALVGLRDHLLLVGREQGVDAPAFAALRGIVHLELDEYEAATLIHGVLSTNSRSPWVTEFRVSWAKRTSDESLVSTDLWTANAAPIVDWVHWRSICAQASSENPDTEFSRMLDLADKIHPGSPLRDEILMRQMFEAGQHAHVRALATRLERIFPSNRDYAFFDAISASELGDWQGALTALDRATKPGVDDPDVLLLKARCKGALAVQKKDPKVVADARQAFADALASLEQHGLPTVDAVRGQAALDEVFPQTSSANVFRGAKAWFVQLSQRRYFELRTSHEDTVKDLVRAIGDKAQPGDICFFAAPSTKGTRSSWQIGAAYMVTTRPAWDPFDGCVSGLKLITRPADPVQVDMTIENPGGMALVGKGPNHPLRKGVFELGEGAVDVIMDAVRQRNAGDAVRIERRSRDRLARTS
jgi:hypothetical protein